jgi:hypothetical protein
MSTMTDYILKTIRRTQYKEISEDKICQMIFQSTNHSIGSNNSNSNSNPYGLLDRIERKKPRKVPRGLTSEAPTGLGWKYHLYDLIGRDLIYRVETGGLKGHMLRIQSIKK